MTNARVLVALSMCLLSACVTKVPRAPAQYSISQSAQVEPAVLFVSLPDSAMIEGRIHQTNLTQATARKRFFCFNRVDKSTVEYPANAIYTIRRSAYLYLESHLACKAIEDKSPTDATLQIEATLKPK